MKQLDGSDRSRLRRIFDTGRKSSGELQLQEATERAGRLIDQLEDKGVPDSLREIWNDILDLYRMTTDSIKGRYRIPMRSLAAVVFTLLYFANPFDIVPDLIPLAGYVDDAFVIGLCLNFIGTDLSKYRKWKKKQSGPTGDEGSQI